MLAGEVVADGLYLSQLAGDSQTGWNKRNQHSQDLLGLFTEAEIGKLHFSIKK
jgi:hypothetical protein